MFQYISCYSLSNRCFKDCPKTQVSMHLMLLFIYCRTSLLGNIKSFQYISCYSLSEQGERTASVRCRFNTSHVTLYRNPYFLRIKHTKFQYISCYSLSVLRNRTLSTAGSFQYISCYSLSFIRCLFSITHMSFNTSHVTLYPESCHKHDSYICVSIHLMLLFIYKIPMVADIRDLFQYISCYSLSQTFF